MDTKQIINIYKNVLRFMSLGLLKQAFDKTRTLADEVQNGNFYDKLNTMEENYRYMLQYYIDGVDDPQRVSIYNKLIAKLFALNEEIRETLLFQNSTGFEYTKKRYYPYTRNFHNVNSLYDSLHYQHQQLEQLSTIEAEHENELKRIRNVYENMLPELFGLYWLSTQYSQEEKNVFRQIMDDNYPGKLEKALLVSAITLNLWRMFDEDKLMMLFDCTLSADLQVRQRALVGLCFILAKFNPFLSYFPAIRNRLVLMADNESTFENFRNIIIQIIATTETEKISKKLQEEILPEIMKISPKLRNSMDTENFLSSDDWDEKNPQWQDLIEESGVSDKLQELSELQMEGADVYMSTFSLLKSFPFFNEFSNWFLPFDLNHSSVHELFQSDDKSVLSAFINSHTMCDSDLYSFCLSITQMPEKQRDMMKNSFKMESEQIQEMQKDEAILSPNVLAKNISKQYIQDLFRFFKLYPQRKDFADMFDLALDLHKTLLFDILSAGSDLKNSIAEYYFSKKIYPQALELFQETVRNEPTAALYQKMGYSYQKLSRINEALEAYLKADIIQPDDLWTVKKIALCYRLLMDYQKALEYYQHAQFLDGGKVSSQMQIANCYLQMGKYKEALNIYFKLDAEDDDNLKIQRAIAWGAFVSGNLKQGEYYIKKVLESPKNISHDYLNAGHIFFSMNQRKEALQYYQKSWEMMNKNWEGFTENFQEDLSHLKFNNIDKKEAMLMLDELMYINE